VRLWDYNNRRLHRTIPISIAIMSVAFSPDSKRLALGLTNGKAEILDLAEENKPLDFQAVESIVHRPGARENFVDQVAFLEAGKTLLTQASGKLRFWDAISGQSRDDLRTDKKFRNFILAPDGETLGFQRNEHNMVLWHLPTGRRQDTSLQLEYTWIDWKAISPDRTTLAGTALYKNIELYDLATRRIRQQIVASTLRVGDVAFSPDGKTLAGKGDTVILWNVATGEELLSLVSPEGSFWTVAFSPDGRTLATSQSTCAIYLWLTADELRETAARH